MFSKLVIYYHYQQLLAIALLESIDQILASGNNSTTILRNCKHKT